MGIHYSTTAVEPGRGFAYWSDVVCRHGILAASRLLIQQAPFAGELVSQPVGAVTVNKMAAPLHQWTRDHVHLRRGQEDDLWLCYLLDGQARLDQGGRAVCFGGGDVVLYDAGRPFKMALDSQSFTFMSVPRQALLHRCPQAERMSARVIDAGAPVNQALRMMIEHAMTADVQGMRPLAVTQLGSTLIDLAAVMLDVQMARAAPVYEHSLYQRALAWIWRNFENPALCLDDLARAHHVSPRTITRAFARQQQTPMGAVWRIRLNASHAALREGRARSITQVALDHGFSDSSHFSRAFRKVFGYAPHTLLRH